LTAAALLLAAVVASPVRAASSFPEMRTDPRFELLGVVQLLADAERRSAGFQRHDIPYQRKALAHFGRHRGHPAVARFSRLSDAGFDYLLAYQFMFALGDPPELAFREQLPAPLVERMGGEASAEEFRRLLSDFSRTSGFPAFYARMAPERESLIAGIRRQARRTDTKGVLERYLGVPLPVRYDFILSSFAEPVLAMTFIRPEADGGTRLTSLYGPEEKEGVFRFAFETRVGGIWWEITTARLMTEGEAYRARLAKSESLYAPLGPSCAASWYDLYVTYCVPTSSSALAFFCTTLRRCMASARLRVIGFSR